MHAGKSYRSRVVSVQSQAKLYASHAASYEIKKVEYPGSRSASSFTKFRGVLRDLLGLALLVAEQ